MKHNFILFFISGLVCAGALVGSRSAAALNVETLSATTPLVANLEPVNIRVQAGDQVRVRGFDGSVVYRAVPNRQALTVRVDETHSRLRNNGWQLNIHRNGHSIIVAVDGPTSKKLWNAILANTAESIPTYNLVLEGPSLPLEINWRKGQVQVSNLDADLKVTNLNGDTRVVGDNGDVSVSAQTGTIELAQLKGHVRIDSYDARVEVNNVKGELNLENFIGSSALGSISGQVAVTTYRGPTHLSGIKGALQSRSAQGAVFAEIEGNADVHMESQTGNVHLTLPKSGAWMDLGTSNGQILVPSFLKVTRLPAELLRTGHLHGINGGTVYVRTTSGNISVQ